MNDNTYEKWAIDGNAYGITERGDVDDKGILTPCCYFVPMDVVIPPDITLGTVFHGTTTFSNISIDYSTTYSYELKVAGYENVSVPGGNFTNALKVVYTDYQDSVPWSMSSWWVDGVGFVKWVEAAGVNGEKYVYELVSWSMK